MKKILLQLSLLMVSPLLLKSQDAHYSGYFRSPLLVNPALTGIFDGNFRLGGIYRSQWKSIKTPNEGYNFYFDKNNRLLSYGFLINQNIAGSEGYKTTNILLSFSLKKQLKAGDNQLSFGAQAGVVQERVDLSKLTFDNQYNPEKGYDPDLESGENFEKGSVLLPDFNVGINWRFSKNIGLPVTGDFGMAFSHINTPKSSFLNENIHIPLKSTFYGKAQFDLSPKVGIEPNLLFAKQGIASEFIYGLNAVFKLNNNNFKIGVGSRAKDALILISSFSFNNFEIGMSYDAHFQAFGNQQNVGSMEFSITYLFGSKPKDSTEVESEQPEPKPIPEVSKSNVSTLDYDGDDIADDKDKCPYESGLEKYNGCNDRDVDGVWDHVDACPSLPGTFENYGCPYKGNNLDSDGDGVFDQVDECIYVKGPAHLNGCPDADDDGITDLSDECPYQKGIKELNGCPPLNGVGGNRQLSNDFIEFETNVSKIQSKYYPFLDRLAFQIKNNENLKIIIEGHTDNEGDHLYNYHLSQERAHNVRNYFFQKGIPIGRVEMYFFGETKPRMENNTDFAKARNRRVELIVVKMK